MKKLLSMSLMGAFLGLALAACEKKEEAAAPAESAPSEAAPADAAPAEAAPAQ